MVATSFWGAQLGDIVIINENTAVLNCEAVLLQLTEK